MIEHTRSKINQSIATDYSTFRQCRPSFSVVKRRNESLHYQICLCDVCAYVRTLATHTGMTRTETNTKIRITVIAPLYTDMHSTWVEFQHLSLCLLIGNMISYEIASTSSTAVTETRRGSGGFVSRTRYVQVSRATRQPESGSHTLKDTHTDTYTHSHHH